MIFSSAVISVIFLRFCDIQHVVHNSVCLWQLSCKWIRWQKERCHILLVCCDVPSVMLCVVLCCAVSHSSEEHSWTVNVLGAAKSPLSLQVCVLCLTYIEQHTVSLCLCLCLSVCHFAVQSWSLHGIWNSRSFAPSQSSMARIRSDRNSAWLAAVLPWRQESVCEDQSSSVTHHRSQWRRPAAVCLDVCCSWSAADCWPTRHSVLWYAELTSKSDTDFGDHSSYTRLSFVRQRSHPLTRRRCASTLSRASSADNCR